jgi:hypothetical protein
VRPQRHRPSRRRRQCCPPLFGGARTSRATLGALLGWIALSQLRFHAQVTDGIDGKQMRWDGCRLGLFRAVDKDGIEAGGDHGDLVVEVSWQADSRCSVRRQAAHFACPTAP